MNFMRRRPRGEGGFTLIELVVVLTLVSIVAALAQPSMSGYVHRNKTRRTLDRLAGDLQMARMLAVRSGDRAVVEVSGDVYRIWMEGAGDTLRTVRLGSDLAGVRLEGPTADGRLVFNSRGLLLTPGSGRLVARLGTVADTLNITAAGRMYRAY